MAPAAPDGVLVSPSEQLDPFDQIRITGHGPMVVPVSAHQIGQDLGVTGIRLGPRGGVAISIAGRSHWAHGKNLVAGRHM